MSIHQERTNDGTYPTDDEKRVELFKEKVPTDTREAVTAVDDIRIVGDTIIVRVNESVHESEHYPIMHVMPVEQQWYKDDGPNQLRVYYRDDRYHNDHGLYHDHE